MRKELNRSDCRIYHSNGYRKEEDAKNDYQRLLMQGKKILTTKEIGARIKKRRTELGISQEDLAETLGVTYQQVQRYENGTNRLNVENIQLIAQTLSMCVSDLLGPAEKAEPQLHAQETKLMRYFRKIGDERSKNLVIQVARLGAKAEGAGNGLKKK